MSSATLQVTIVPKRMLTKSESAHHRGRSLKRFEIECPVAPVRFANGDLRYDVHDLDRWLDTFKTGAAEVDEILRRLG